ncbi:MAG: class I SAM-dependent methyltransferase [Prevotellaceae bacterium]|jgi:ubiquinone/menaquinone biosynthesis C-methylase UbiE|nr:class I SAM-dependent methyltransferase [Prevotellaceae bacterium]
MKTEENRKQQWDASYSNKDNFVWYPNEEVIRFVSAYLKKKTGIKEYKVIKEANSCLDAGCGIGRHVFFLDDYGFEPYGIDLSTNAIEMAKDICLSQGKKHLINRFTAGSATSLPYSDSRFDFAVSCSVLDSMDFELACKSVREIARVLKPEGLFCFDVIARDARYSGDNVHILNGGGQIAVNEQFEYDTIQSYFDENKINRLLDNRFNIISNRLITTEVTGANTVHCRYFLVAEKV